MKLANVTSTYRAGLISKTYRNWVKQNDKLLDVGCGTGVVAKEIKNNLGSNVCGCDIKNYLITKLPFKKMPTDTTLPKYKQKFDVIMFNDTLHHTEYPKQEKLIKEAINHSKSVLLFELKPTSTNKIFDYLINKIHYKNLEIPFTYRSEVQWEKLFKSLHLKFKKKLVNRPLLYPFTHIAYILTK